VPARRWPDLWRFVNSPSVRVVQHLLAYRGYPVTVSGTFDAATVAAVQDWQARNGIAVDVDATLTTPTWETLAPELDQHAAGAPVTAVQEILATKGYAVTVTGAYDHATRRAVQDLQALHGLPRNGKLSTSTWCTVVGGSVRESFRHR
jgi:peptidoglycan hydrolase-like protein with peptidoglycan-binding domain